MKKKSLSTDKKVVTFGEVMLRLTTPGFRRFSQTNEFIATYGCLLYTSDAADE